MNASFCRELYVKQRILVLNLGICYFIFTFAQIEKNVFTQMYD